MDTLKRYNITEAAQLLGFAVITLRRKVLSREITCYRPSGNGRKILFSDEHLKEFIDRHTHRAKEALNEKGLAATRP